MVEAVVEQPSSAEQRLRRYARTSRMFMLFSGLSFVFGVWLILALVRSEYWGDPVLDGVLLLNSAAGLTCNMAAVVAGMKASRKGIVWLIVAVLGLHVQGFMALVSVWVFLGGSSLVGL